MKAERRHDLKTNTLARGLEGVPNFWREHGNRLLLVVLVAAIVFLLVRYWNDKKARDAQSVTESLQTAHIELGRLGQLQFELANGMPPAAIAEDRDRTAQQTEQAISTVLNLTKDKRLLANAYLLRGDLNWDLANFPALPGAETQPALDVPNRDGLLEKSAASYQQSLDPTLAANLDDIFYAHTGLAAIAENQSQWDKAKQQYQAILDAPNMTVGYKDYAKSRIERLPELQSNVLLVPPPQVPTSVPFGPPAPIQSPATSPAPATSQPTGSLTKENAGAPLILPTTKPATTQP